MGIPRFFRWLVERYPLVLQDCSPLVMPEVDNLYLDLNGVIHVSAHAGTLGALVPHLESALP